MATNADGDGPASAADSVVPQGAVTVPDAPTGVTATAGSGIATVSWSAPADDGGSPITGYTVTASPGGATCSTTETTSCVLTGLTNGTEYTVTVVATNAEGDGTGVGTGDRDAVGSAGGADRRDRDRRERDRDDQLDAATDDGGAPITGYTAQATPGGALCSTFGATSCVLTGLANGTEYSVVVIATNPNGESPTSTPVTVTPAAPATVPGAPTGVSAAPGNGVATVTWSAPADDGGSPITGYTVSASPGEVSCSTSGATSCLLTGLTNGTEYTVTVVATNAEGDGPESASVTVTPSGPPGPPTDVTATPGDGNATITWNPPTDDGGAPILGYFAQASPGGATCAITGATVCTLAGLTNGTDYSVVVIATNANGQSPASAPVTVTPAAAATVPGAPTGVEATPGDGQAAVSWTPPGSDGGSPITGLHGDCVARRGVVLDDRGDGLHDHRAHQRHHLRHHGRGDQRRG